MPDRVCVAQIGAPHGVRGEVRLWTFTGDPMAVAQYGPLETEDGKRSFETKHARMGRLRFGYHRDKRVLGASSKTR